jgi:membrane-bound lytic murein transglycosylase A
MTSAKRDSSKMSVMYIAFHRFGSWFVALCAALIVSHSAAQTESPVPPANFLPSLHPQSQWIFANWDDLPQIFEDNPREVLGAWLASCARPQAAWRLACNELAALKHADAEVLRIWMQSRLQPYRVAPLTAKPDASTASHEGLLTGYYEPIFKASRTATERYRYPIYQLPLALAKNKTLEWLSREEIDKQGALPNQAIAYLDDPMDVLALHIQGSGQLELQSEHPAAGRIRLAFAGTNNQPYKSVGAWMRETHGVRELSWPAIRAWAKNNPQHLNALLWSNPRVVFFKEEAVPNALTTSIASTASHLANPITNNAEPSTPVGPRGAAGVPLASGRAIAVDPQSIPYGTPVWLVSSGDSIQLAKLVIAQDTGAAIKGAVRADYFVGSGDAAGDIAGRLKQPLQMWVLWPK